MKTIAILSQKGGAGKTTLAIHLAVAAAQEKLNTLIVDLDPQASAAKWGDRREAELPLVISSHASRLDSVLKNARDNDGHLAILDTAPNSDSITLQAARAADFVLIPCRPAILDLEAITSTLDLVRTANTPAVVVLNAVAPVGTEAEDAAEAIAELNAEVCPVRLVSRVAFSRSLIGGQAAQEIEPAGKATQEVLALHKFVCERVHVFTSKVPHYA
jgi:chromosome partitioning protein